MSDGFLLRARGSAVVLKLRPLSPGGHEKIGSLKCDVGKPIYGKFQSFIFLIRVWHHNTVRGTTPSLWPTERHLKTRTSIPDERGCRRQFRSGSTSVSLCSLLPGGNMYSNHARYIITYHRSVLRQRHAKVELNEWFCIPKKKKKSCLSTSDSTSLILCTCIIHGCQIQSAVLLLELSGEEEKKKVPGSAASECNE